jgi:hypothetical protein
VIVGGQEEVAIWQAFTKGTRLFTNRHFFLCPKRKIVILSVSEGSDSPLLKITDFILKDVR